MHKNKKVINYSIKTMADDLRKFSVALSVGSSVGMIYKGFDSSVIYSFIISFELFLAGHFIQLVGGVHD